MKWVLLLLVPICAFSFRIPGYPTKIDESTFDPALAEKLIQFFQQEATETLVDFGSSSKAYVSYFRNYLLYCETYDRYVQDLGQKIDLPSRFDWVFSLQAGESIPAWEEEAFIDNLCRHTLSGIVVSWAGKNPNGIYTPNAQKNEVIEELFSKRGFSRDLAAEKELRGSASMPIFENTLMVFKKR